MDIEAIVIVLIVFSALTASIVAICLATYSAKKLEHKQIIAAIEKGTPLSELKPLKPAGLLWIRYLTAGVALLIIGLGFGLMRLNIFTQGGTKLFIAFVLVAIGMAWLIRGLLYRKYQLRIQSSDKNNKV